MTVAAENPEHHAGANGQRADLSDKTKFAIRTALSLTLAYLIPMALGGLNPRPRQSLSC